ncbi:HD-GYP domain-containing protein [Candidatus Aerophobetes bacterium]|nr:HD-GYP domain-containing protein [Candidatus Aerophobetes bacterium]
MKVQTSEETYRNLIKVEAKLQKSVAKLQKSLAGTIQALANTVEMRDPYTAAHQKRVAQLVLAIARHMKLSEEKINALLFAATIHDLGKIHIPSEILSKPGRLTQVELDMIKSHPQAGYEVLKGIEFPWQVAKIVLQHHERMDGSGYPQGLKKGEILLEARILAVADVVEAMSSHRPYRAAPGMDKALEEIVHNKGKLYDAWVVDACRALFRSTKFTW